MGIAAHTERSVGKDWLLSSALAIALLLTLGACPALASPPVEDTGRAEVKPDTRPNVLVIMTDDVGFGTTDVYGGPVPTTAFRNLAE